MTTAHVLEAQVRRVRRRLFLQVLVSRVIWCLSGAILASAVWFLVEPLLLDSPAAWLRWTVAGGLTGIGAVTAVVLAWRAAPSRLVSALSLDERFDLKERVTTTLSLTPEQASSPAGTALLEDVNARVGSLDVPAKFPIRLSWLVSLVPAAAALLMLVALFYEPAKTDARTGSQADRKLAVAEKAKLDKQFEQLRPRREFNPQEREKSEKIKEIEAEMEKIANKPRNTREQVRERIKEMNQLEEKARDQQKELADKTKGLQQKLQEMGRQTPQDTKDGPAREMQDAMAKGDFEKAKEELDKLAKKLQEGQMSDKEREQLKNQLADLQKKAEQVQEKQKQKEQELEKKINEAKAQGKDAESLERELHNVKQQGLKNEALKDLAKKLGDCKDCMSKGDNKGAAEKLQSASDQMKEMNLSDKEMKELQNQIEKLQQAKECAGKECQGDKDGDKAGKESGNGNKPGKGDQPGKPQGQNPNSPAQQGGGGAARNRSDEAKTNSYEAKQRSEFDPKGKKVFEGFTPGKAANSPTVGPEVGEVKQAIQESTEAVENQRIPRSARDSAKGYFRNLGGQLDKDVQKPAEEKK